MKVHLIYIRREEKEPTLVLDSTGVQPYPDGAIRKNMSEVLEAVAKASKLEMHTVQSEHEARELNASFIPDLSFCVTATTLTNGSISVSLKSQTVNSVNCQLICNDATSFVSLLHRLATSFV